MQLRGQLVFSLTLVGNGVVPDFAFVLKGGCSLLDMHSPSLCRQFLDNAMFLDFFERVEVANFEIASDAFSTFKARWGTCLHTFSNSSPHNTTQHCIGQHSTQKREELLKQRGRSMSDTPLKQVACRGTPISFCHTPAHRSSHGQLELRLMHATLSMIHIMPH